MKTHMQEIINAELDKCETFNIVLDNGTILTDVRLFTDKTMYTSAIYNTEEYNNFLCINNISNKCKEKKVNLTIYFGNDCVQGWFIPERISSIERSN